MSECEHISMQDAVGCKECNPQGHSIADYKMLADAGLDPDTDHICEKCEERPATHQALVREEMLSDERGTVWGHVNVWLCDHCDRDEEPDWDAIREEREERKRWEWLNGPDE